MCGRYVQTMPADVMRQLFQTSGPLPNPAPSLNVAPTQSAPVVRRHPETGERHLDLLRWGLLPRWVKDPKGARQPINARAETVATSPMFREAYAKRRCLVPADAFYEWKKLDAKTKQPYAIGMADRSLFGFAGLWEGWKDPEGNWLHTYTIITGEPNLVSAPIHDRMPAILRAEDEASWLDPETTDPLEALGLLSPYPADLMEGYAVSTAVNAVGNDGPELVRPLD